MRSVALAVVAMLTGVAMAQPLPKNTNALKTLTVEQAKALVAEADEDLLYLNGLTELSPEVAEALAQHKGILYLNGLAAVSDEAAEALSQNKGDLSLDGVRTLSEKAAQAFSHHDGSLFLGGLTALSGEAAAMLRGNPKVFFTVDERVFRRPNEKVVTRQDIASHNDKCAEVTTTFLAKYLNQHPEFVRPAMFFVGGPNAKITAYPFRRNELLSKLDFGPAWKWLVKVYDYGINSILVPAVQPVGSDRRPNPKAVALALSALREPDNWFVQAKDFAWSATAAKDRWVLVGDTVLTHEELWALAHHIDREFQKQQEVPRVRD